MKELWLLGRDVAASPSPRMHNAALDELGLPSVYSARSVDPADIDDALDAAQHACRGINVTAPFKLHAAQRYAAALDPVARSCGAVNTVVFSDDGVARATNTDVLGLKVAWRRASVDVAGRVVAIVGGGGAARAAVIAAEEAGAAGVTLHVRRGEAREALEDIARLRGLRLVDSPAHLLVLAATELDEPAATIRRCLPTPAAVHDLRYGARASATRDAALRAGHVFLDGTTMLLAQGQAALSLFLGATLPDAASAAMARAVSAWLRRA